MTDEPQDLMKPDEDDRAESQKLEDEERAYEDYQRRQEYAAWIRAQERDIAWIEEHMNKKED